MITRRPALTQDLALDDTIHPVLAKVYASRGISGASELNNSATALARFDSLSGMAVAVDVLQDALFNNKRILIVGDYDADGATSTAVMIRGLRSMGASEVQYLVPNRFEFGYGLSPAIVEVAKSHSPDVLITVDNGISSIDGVASARAAGMAVIVTDHHLPGAQLPDANAIVNPNVAGDEFPSKCLAGVGVAFYLLAALRARLAQTDWFTRIGATPKLADLLDLVALGTVADVVPLDHNNRIFVAQGLARIRAGRCCPGIVALMQIGKRDPARAVASDLGFAVGPRLNAAGRLQDMTIGIECLLTDSDEVAGNLAGALNDLNVERRSIEAEMTESAERHLEQIRLDGDLPAALSLFEPDWHPGVVGIVASRVKDRVHRPVIAFAPDGDDFLKGSARSVTGLHIKDALEAVAARKPALIRKFGGHAMAAGLTVERAAFNEFRDEFAAVVAEVLGPDGAKHEHLSDGPLDPADRNLALAEAIRLAGPWGQEFPEPMFDDEFQVLEQRIVGGTHLKLRLGCVPSGRSFDAIAFGLGEQHPCPRCVRALYQLDVNTFRGNTTVQLMVKHLEPS
jgi:single-stranded-DNA-specific exonuclease